MSLRDNFINKFFNPALSFLKQNTHYDFRSITLKKYRKNEKYSFYNSNDLLKKIQEIKQKWNEIKWQLSIKKMYSKEIDNFFNLLFSVEKNGKFQKSFTEIYKSFSSKNSLNNLFFEAKNLNNEFEKIQNYMDLENELENYIYDTGR